MKLSALRCTLLACAIASGLSGCTLDGDDGATGPKGTDGAAGQPGTPGQNAQIGISTQAVARFVTGTYGAGAAEITQYHSASKRIYVVNGASNRVEILDASAISGTALTDAITASTLTSTPLAMPATVTVKNALNADETLTLGFANSIAISGNILAIAAENAVKSSAGAVLFYNISAATPSFIKAVKVGALPDMVTFSPDGSMLLVANEGEPESDYSVDPEGSVGLIAVTAGVVADQAELLTFTTFNSQQAELAAQGVKFAAPAGTTVAQDLEPEYITISSDSKKAFVSLQENNALAIIDLTEKQISKLVALGFKDYSQSLNALDVSNRDGVKLATYPGVYGMYQPDTLASYNWKGATFILSANEGDARDWDAYSEESRVRDLTRSADLTALQAEVYDDNGLGRLNVSMALGQNADGDYDALYAYGARSFSIWDQNGNLVFDSGADFERISSGVHGELFNTNHTVVEGDSRSDDKGPEPEAVTIGQVGDKTYAFISAERLSGIFVYDVTNPYDAQFVDYFHNRNFDAVYEIDDDAVPAEVSGDYQQAGDLGPESLVFVPAADSATGQALLLMANEVSGSLTVFEVSPRY
jgi:DNA-binding beta-propeller fold protein YncE